MKMEVAKNVLLSEHTTLKVGGVADYMVEVKDESELMEALRFAKQTAMPPLVLGGGSNILASDEGCRGLVIKNRIKGVEYNVHGDNVYVSCGAGEMLDKVIEETVNKNYWGLENLSHIPGTVGATPVQNVGAYGVEVCSLITEVSAINIETEQKNIFSNEECKFSYRDSYFKTNEGKKWIVTKVVFKLSLLKSPKLSYGALQDLEKNKSLTIQDIRNEVIRIRSTKFPDWNNIGTAGSFFKNPIIPNKQFADLLIKYPDLPGYSVDSENTKIALGWVLDNVCSLKGYCENGVCLFKQQALVLINESAKDSATIDDFANFVTEKVKEKIGVDIEREVTKI
ncbi:UDP-N-acetylmuramate dehydrogenase [Candidatus Nomurabacteria bacterium]|nr:UDP-N-acetylmuramate dehydrogenase [Candidatus Nomurabacteria bacterium]